MDSIAVITVVLSVIGLVVTLLSIIIAMINKKTDNVREATIDIYSKLENKIDDEDFKDKFKAAMYENEKKD